MMMAWDLNDHRWEIVNVLICDTLSEVPALLPVFNAKYYR